MAFVRWSDGQSVIQSAGKPASIPHNKSKDHEYTAGNLREDMFLTQPNSFSIPFFRPVSEDSSEVLTKYEQAIALKPGKLFGESLRSEMLNFNESHGQWET